MKKWLVAFVVPTLVLVSAASAAEGRIPVLSLAGPPYVITSPGSYILTRDVDSPGDAAIEIRTDGVALDLGGHTVTGPASLVAPAISFLASGSRLVTVRNGQLVSGSQGFIGGGSTNSVRLEGLDVSQSITGINAGGDEIEIVNCRVHDLIPAPSGGVGAGIDVNALGGRLIGNLVQDVPGSGIATAQLRGGEIRHNVVRNFGSGLAGASGILLTDSLALPAAGGNIVADNTVDGPGSGISDDVGIKIESPFNLIRGNISNYNGSAGISIRSNDNRIEGNVTQFNGTDGLLVRSLIQGSRFEGNQSQQNKGCGLNVTGSALTIYSNGTFATNSGGNVCGVGVNAGGNFCETVPCP